jgi:hypothetical protein
MTTWPGDRLRCVVGSLAFLAAAVHGDPARGIPLAGQITIAGDSVIVTGLADGIATVQVMRRDERTRAPVVIGEFSGPVRSPLPFTVNTIAPDPLYERAGDCWQAGALHLAGGVGLTPDIRPGDTVAVVGGPSVTVTDAGAGTRRGPIWGCTSLSAFAENAVTSAPATLANAKLVVSGVAQPLTAAVVVSASAGGRSTAVVRVVPTADGRWTATIPAAQIARLAKGPVTVAAVFAVPDVGSGAAAQIAGTPRTVEKVVRPSPIRPGAIQPGAIRKGGPHRRPGPARTRARKATRALSVRDYARQQAAVRGWTGAQWQALEEIVRSESHWNPCAVYPSRHNCTYAGYESCGVPQAQPCPPAWRGRLWQVRFAQVRWLLDYIDRRYGHPQGALQFRRSHGYY